MDSRSTQIVRSYHSPASPSIPPEPAALSLRSADGVGVGRLSGAVLREDPGQDEILHSTRPNIHFPCNRWASMPYTDALIACKACFAGRSGRKGKTFIT